jgi:putative transposase
MARNYYAELYYHFVWRTKRREGILVPRIQPQLFAAIKNHCVEYGTRPIEVGGIEDHVHLLITAPPTVLLSEFIGKLKGASSRFVNKDLDLPRRFSWGEGYGVLTLAKVNVPGVRAYIRSQREHHEAGTVRAKMERTDPDAPEGGR